MVVNRFTFKIVQADGDHGKGPTRFLFEVTYKPQDGRESEPFTVRFSEKECKIEPGLLGLPLPYKEGEADELAAVLRVYVAGWRRDPDAYIWLKAK